MILKRMDGSDVGKERDGKDGGEARRRETWPGWPALFAFLFFRAAIHFTLCILPALQSLSSASSTRWPPTPSERATSRMLIEPS